MSLADLLPTFVTLLGNAFLMGSPERELSDLARRYGGTRESYREESPQHSLCLPAFAIARTPLTNALYAAYVVNSGALPPLHWRGLQPPSAISDHPVVNVSWQEALACCAWLATIADCRLQIADRSRVGVCRPGGRWSQLPLGRGARPGAGQYAREQLSGDHASGQLPCRR